MAYRMEWLAGFIRYLMTRLWRDELTYAASALTITTLLAMVPLLSLVFTFLARLPVSLELASNVENFIFTHFVPSISDDLQTNLHGFIEQAGQLSTIGFISLVVTALIMMRTIERAFQKIWHSSTKRKAIKSLLIYWVVLVLGPLFLGLSIFLSSYFTSLLLIYEGIREVGLQLRVILPVLLSIIGLTLLYWLIPNAKVRFLHAFIGATTAGILFELVKVLFTSYVTHFPVQEVIFGTLAVIPLFMIWVYLSWLLILIGAEITHGLMIYKPVGRAKDSEISAS